MLEKLILYFVVKTKGFISKTQLVKFLYLADLYSVKWTEKQLTDLDWRYYQFGPWHEKIEQVLKNFYQTNVLQESCENQTNLIKLSSKIELENFKFSKGLELMLNNIHREWAGSQKLDSLLNYVYQTVPMIDAQKYHQPEEKAILNLQLERQKLVEELGV